MKLVLLLVAPLLLALASATSSASDPASEQAVDPARFMVTLSEYQLEDNVPVSASEADILDLIRKTNVMPKETIRLSVLKNIEGMVQFGKRVALTIGKSVNRDVTTRHTQDFELGSLLKVTINLEDEAIKAKIAFESSRLQGEGTDYSPPDIATIAVNTTQLIELGRPCLIGSTSSGTASYIFMSISEID